MKARVKIDVGILIFIILFTGVLFRYPQLYWFDTRGDDILDFLGFVGILKGVFIRMAARGFKKAHSLDGRGLVAEGPYRLIRNPMYLGSFLLGSGFIFIAWPFWCFPIFAFAFYLRFRRQIVKEEKYLSETFGGAYQEYAARVPRLFPNFQKAMFLKVREAFPLEYLWTTKEKFGLIGWPALAVILESLQEKIIFGQFDLLKTLGIFGCAYALLAAAKLWEYRRG